MCGIAGLWQTRGMSEGELGRSAVRMADSLAHRGPDDAGQWVDARAGVALGFRRLAIVDLSPNGRQPMRSVSGRYTIVFNGEVYNHSALRAELEAAGAAFRGHCDAEVIVAAFERWGVEASVRRFVGMFAIAAWDAGRRELTLVRDRLGIKPLFVHAEPGCVSFGSELRAVRTGPRFEDAVDPTSVAAYLRYLYVPAPATIHPRVRKLLPGHLLTVRDPERPLPPARPFWALDEVALAGAAAPLELSDAEAVARFEALLTDAVRLRMEADVPLGALLSGGVDSATVVAVMQAASRAPVRTFTIGFDQREHDESRPARAIARHLGTDHTELRVGGREALGVVAALPDIADEPLADPSLIPTYLVCRLARRHVTVALTGDGGDELFAGYTRYLAGPRLIEWADRWPRPVRRLASACTRSLGPETWTRLHATVAPLLPAAWRTRLAGTKLRKLGRVLAGDGMEERYRALVSAWTDPGALVDGGPEPDTRADALFRLGTGRLDLMERMMLADQGGYLPDDLLAKVDRASMAVSLEARVPLLDHRLVELSWRLPRRFKVRQGTGKWILRQVLARHLPPALVAREKVGFTVPLAAWLRGPLREWAGDLLEPSRLGGIDGLRPSPVRREWDRLRRGNGDQALGVWAVLLLVAWRERWGPSAPRAEPRAVVEVA